MSTLVVRYGDEHGHHVGGDVWTSTDFLAYQDGVVAQGLDWDWSDPDLGIRYRRLFAGYETADESPAQASQRPSDAVQADEHVRETSGALALVPRVYATEWRVLVSDEDLAHALSVVVDGQVVVERPREGVKPDFRCGLSWPDEVHWQRELRHRASAPRHQETSGGGEDSQD